MAVIPDGDVCVPHAYNEHLIWGAILVLLLTRGPGVFSLDDLIGRYAHKGSQRRAIA